MLAVRRLDLTKNLSTSLAEHFHHWLLAPFCAWCEKMRTQTGEWREVGPQRTHATHGVCLDCLEHTTAGAEDGRVAR